MSRSERGGYSVDKLGRFLFGLFALDRALKLGAIFHFFARKQPDPPLDWPSVTLLQPVSRGTSDLLGALLARARLDYSAPVQHIFVCDEADEESQSLCCGLMTEFPDLWGEMEIVPRGESPVASKTVKLQAGFARARGDVVVSIDDDIFVRPDALRMLIPYLFRSGTGAVFGLACYTNWSNLPSALMSAFVNLNALLTYVPGTYLVEPFTITGHIYAIKRGDLLAVGGFDGLEDRIGDDHDMAQRLRFIGLRSVQTPLMYDVENRLATMRDYAVQMKRWFVFPRQALLPYMSRRERAATALAGVGSMLPAMLALLALVTGNRSALRWLAASLGLSCTVYTLGERLYLKRSTPPKSWPLVPAVALLSPAQVLVSLFSDDVVEWRGKRLSILKGGDFVEVVE